MNQTERFDEIFRRGKGLLDFMDEVVKASGIDIEHERLREAVIEAAKAWKLKVDADGNEKWSNHYVAMCKAIDSLIDFERGIKEQS